MAASNPKNRKPDIVNDDGAIAVSDQMLRQLLGYNLKRAFNEIRADLTKTLAPFDLRMVTYSALTLIVENPGLRQSHLADALSIERPNLVIIVDELEQRELITREKVAGDRRAYALRATLAGRRLQQKAHQADRAHEQRILKNMSHDEVQNLIASLQSIEVEARTIK